MRNYHRNKQAFTLVELAIVLAIVGLITAAVVTSASIVKQATARGVVSEILKLRSILDTFKGTYNLALPGDMENAYDYFGDTCGGDSSAPSGCNGNGNGNIGFSSNDNGYQESYRFWQHLKLARLLDDDVSGTKNGSAPYSNSLNMFSSKAVSGAVYFPEFPYDWSAGQFHSRDIQITNVYILGRQHASAEQPYNKALTAKIAYSIDLKMDDGNPRTGGIKAYNYKDSSNGWHGSTSGMSAGTECTSIGNVSKSDSLLEAAYYEIGRDSEECILLIDF